MLSHPAQGCANAPSLASPSILSPPEPPDADAAAAAQAFAHHQQHQSQHQQQQQQQQQQHQPPPHHTPKRKFHDAFTASAAAPAPDVPVEPAEQPASASLHPPPPPPPQSQSQPQSHPDLLPNIRQPLPRSPPRPSSAAAVGAIRTHGYAPAVAATAADDDRRSPGHPPPMMAGSPGIKRTPLRSSIACQRCRKSKIKCNNTGGDSPCETCLRNGKECSYPEATPAPAKRAEPPTAGAKVEQGSERKRLRRIEDIVKMEGAVPAAVVAEDVLSAPYLTEAVWSQLFDIYRLHFATELPFLHLATLKEKLGSRFRAKPSDTSPEINLVLLGILTLTARFHSTLVSYITAPRNSPAMSASGAGGGGGGGGGGGPLPKIRPSGGPASDASSASEYYADVLTKALGGLRTSMTVASVERVQAFLMLGLYEWSQARPRVGGMAAWMYVGVAIRMAQALGLGDGDKEPPKGFRSRPARPVQQTMPQGQRIIAKEIRRRTMFSCLILDRLLGCGKDRVSTIRSEDLQIQLPCSEVSFDLSDEVYTGFLKPVSGVEPNLPISDSVLGRFVRLVDLWGEISKWSFSGGRFTEDLPPWSPESTFYQLREKLEAFYGDLPDHFRWSDSNYYKHENHQASSVYVSLHMLGAVCRIMLHREYIPFIPIQCDKPVGPLDEPTFPAGEEPQGFWEVSAEEIFHAAKEIVDLTEICRDKLPMSSLVLFAVWTAAFVGIYAVHFPHIDTKGHMLPKQDFNGELDVRKHGPTGLTYKMLNHMALWLKLAETYVGYFRDMACFYDRVKQDYMRHMGRRPLLAAAATTDSKLSLRITGGGLEEWKQQGFKVVNNGEILAIEEEKSSSRDSTAEPGSSVGGGPDSASHHTDHKTPRSTSISSFTPINSAHHQTTTHPDPDTAAAEAAASTLWRLPAAGQRPHSPSQSSGGGAMPSPQITHPPPPATTTAAAATMSMMTKLPPYDTAAAGGVQGFLEQNQSLPWNMAPGGIDQFAHGTEEMVPVDNGNEWLDLRTG
ncbi:hypothetical protein C8A05DRAFT_40870 [Staphylotrichum tortipilum]|uniref:Zn(2)-C6 fungal-type domain-containing protein n=1 Tax=Staphylotrichum tortipilum TaxID=2831512 RepID=A0AAN6MSL8_9PEZI|nr:hypothetical protein C8A05DRAFT_40870 [Staphylotrichum longicolle]